MPFLTIPIAPEFAKQYRKTPTVDSLGHEQPADWHNCVKLLGVVSARLFEEPTFCAFTENFADHMVSAISFEN
jgi:hypothetical protein